MSAATLPGLEHPVFTLICRCAFCDSTLATETYRLGDAADEREAYAFADLTLTMHSRECSASRTSPDSSTSEQAEHG